MVERLCDWKVPLLILDPADNMSKCPWARHWSLNLTSSRQYMSACEWLPSRWPSLHPLLCSISSSTCKSVPFSNHFSPKACLVSEIKITGTTWDLCVATFTGRKDNYSNQVGVYYANNKWSCTKCPPDLFQVENRKHSTACGKKVFLRESLHYNKYAHFYHLEHGTALL